MTNTELEALRRLLFFSPPEAALLVGGVSEQAWRRWEAGTRRVPDDVALSMNGLARWRESAITSSMRQIGEAPSGAKMVLVWYESAYDWMTLPNREPIFWRPHQSVCAALLARLPGLRLVRFDSPAYAAWLAGREDSETMRSVWAAEA